MPNIESGMRERIAEFLPRAVEAALASYQDFSEKEDVDDAKDFKAHHDACKVAIAHIELLIKLARWADLPDPQVEGEDNRKIMISLVDAATREIDGFDGEGDTL